MKVIWTNTFTTDFDLDQAEEDFHFIMEESPNKDPEVAIYDAVEANWEYDDIEGIDASPAIEQCAKTLRKRIGGVQLEMELD